MTERSMQDEELLRYSRHILLDDIGIEGQTRILQGHALIIGAGGLGSPAAMYLACSGIGQITLVDDDNVELTNLQRQIAHTTANVGQPKVASAKETLLALNPHVQVNALAVRADAALLDTLVAQADVVLDCCDNFATRQAVNAACVKHRKPLVSGAAIQMDGQITVYDPRDASSPCYACVFPPGPYAGRNPLRHHGRFRAFGRHHWCHASRRGFENPRVHWPSPDRTFVDARWAQHGMDPGTHAAQSGLFSLQNSINY